MLILPVVNNFINKLLKHQVQSLLLMSEWNLFTDCRIKSSIWVLVNWFLVIGILMIYFQENIECKAELTSELTENVTDLLDNVGHSMVIAWYSFVISCSFLIRPLLVTACSGRTKKKAVGGRGGGRVTTRRWKCQDSTPCISWGPQPQWGKILPSTR